MSDQMTEAPAVQYEWTTGDGVSFRIVRRSAGELVLQALAGRSRPSLASARDASRADVFPDQLAADDDPDFCWTDVNTGGHIHQDLYRYAQGQLLEALVGFAQTVGAVRGQETAWLDQVPFVFLGEPVSVSLAAAEVETTAPGDTSRSYRVGGMRLVVEWPDPSLKGQK